MSTQPPSTHKNERIRGDASSALNGGVHSTFSLAPSTHHASVETGPGKPNLQHERSIGANEDQIRAISSLSNATKHFDGMVAFDP